MISHKMQTKRCKDGYPTMSKYICYKESSKTTSKWKTYTKFPSQTGECGLVKWLGENISELILGRHMDKCDVSFLNIISQEVVSHFNMLGFGMEHWVFGNAYGTGAITQKWNLGTLLTKVTQSIGDPKELGTATSSSNILSVCGGLGYTGLLARGPRHQRGT